MRKLKTKPVKVDPTKAASQIERATSASKRAKGEKV
jgi:hypothetical protein